MLSVAAMVLAGCATPPKPADSVSAFAATDPIMTSSTNTRARLAPLTQPMPGRLTAGLAGRALMVASPADLVLEPGEVVLTFDDGPRPGRTDAILEALDAHGVKAVFLMLGSAAERHPDLARAVAEKGHTIGSHTYDHVDLATLSLSAAMAEIYAGQQAVAAALAPANRFPSRFFRFPYLSQTGLIRTNVIDSNFLVLDVDVDSKDYYSDTPQTVLDRTLERLDARGSGIILFHDIHTRTAALLPDLLDQLRVRGYRVVNLRSSGGSVFDLPLVTAATSWDDTSSI